MTNDKWLVTSDEWLVTNNKWVDGGDNWMRSIFFAKGWTRVTSKPTISIVRVLMFLVLSFGMLTRKMLTLLASPLTPLQRRGESLLVNAMRIFVKLFILVSAEFSLISHSPLAIRHSPLKKGKTFAFPFWSLRSIKKINPPRCAVSIWTADTWIPYRAAR